MRNPFDSPGAGRWEEQLGDLHREIRRRVHGERQHRRHGGFGETSGPGFPGGGFGEHAGRRGGPAGPEGMPGFPGGGPGGFGGPGFPPAGFPGGGPGGFGPGFPPGFGPGFGGGRGGGGRGGRRGGHGHTRGRARRGNVRSAVLILLAEKPMHGYEIIQEIAKRSGGWWRPSPGSVYPTLQLLADEGLITTEHQEGTGKRLYSITEEGKTEAAKQDKTPPWEQAADDVDAGDVALREALVSLMDAARQVASVAGPELKTKATKILTDTRRELYLILADADPYGAGETQEADSSESEDSEDSDES